MSDFFPVQCAEIIQAVGLMVRQARLDQGLRQIDLGERVSASLRTVRRIEAGEADGVSLRDFMMILWALGISDRAFSGLDTDKAYTRSSEEISKRRVRVRTIKEGDF